jgi:DNA-binding transcriptional LysR family regulator
MTGSLDDILGMAVFARVVEARSFTDAAKRLGLAKSAVSARVGRLEESVGVRLLHRTTRKLSLTEDGLAFYERCARLLAAADEAAAVVEESGGAPSGTLRVTAPLAFSQLHLAAAAADFLTRNPRVTLDLNAEDRLVDLVAEGFDLAVRIGRIKESTLIARKLADDRLVVCGAPAYLARRGVPRVPDDLLRHNCLRYTNIPTRLDWRFRDAKGEISIVPVTGSLIAGNGTILRQAAVAGLGLAVLPSFMIADELSSGRLRTVLGGYRRGRIGIYAVYPSRRQTPAKVRAFVDALATFLDRHFTTATDAPA